LYALKSCEIYSLVIKVIAITLKCIHSESNPVIAY
jgi:hypothetical protein